jgi:hypothetical protein
MDGVVYDQDDFDIIEDEDEERVGTQTWLWIGAVALVALFAFGVGAAFMLVSNRLATPEPPATPAGNAGITVTRLALVTSTVSPAVTGTLTASTVLTLPFTPTPTATLSPTATPAPQVICSEPVEEIFVPLYAEEQFGCATGAAQVVWAAWQRFERGNMLWRSDSDASFVLYGDGRWFPVQERWDGGPAADRGAPPPGLQTPTRGFGYVWSRSDEIFNGLGWATDQERGFCAVVQDFEQGYMLRSSDVPSCTAEGLYNHATAAEWAPVLVAASADGRWRNVPAPNVPAASGGERPAGALSRPATHGIYEAARLDGLILDGDFGEWQNNWVPLNAIVFGLENHAGPGDLSANFQTAWLQDGLALAIRVNDDVYRVGPIGTDQWQGDGLELQFDRQLAEDFNSTQADGDDYQIGVAFDQALRAVRGYIWLPFVKESALDLPGAVVSTLRGYQVEVLIPWPVFDLTGDALSTDTAYGFNLSVNDNDGNLPAQQTVASASGARTTHDNPTEWGTLRFLP